MKDMTEKNFASNNHNIKKEYSDRETEKILKQEIEIPEKVNQRIQDTYAYLEIEKEKTGRRKGRGYTWKIAVAALAIIAGLGTVGFAANKYMAVLKSEKGESIQYTFQVDRTKEAHAIQVEPTYMPDGYVCGEKDSAYYGKWHNEETGGGISIIPMNAAELDKMERLDQTDEFLHYKRSEQQKEMSLGDQQVDVYVSEDFYIDSDNTIKNIYLYNEEEGYAIQVWSRSNLPYEEVLKVAEGLKVTVLDKVVPYATDEEIKEAKAEIKQLENAGTGVDSVSNVDVYAMGDEIANPFTKVESIKDEVDDVRFTVNAVEIKDSISLDEYPQENFIDYENEMKPWMNEDGTLKEHERYVMGANGEIEKTETVHSKYVIVHMTAKNCGDTQSEWNQSDGVSIAPDMTTLVSNGDGILVRQVCLYSSANEDYMLQWSSSDGSSFPVYFDKMYYTGDVQRLKHGLWHPLAAGEELEYTLIYIVDEDQVDQSYLWFFSGVGGTDEQGVPITGSYVKVK